MPLKWIADPVFLHLGPLEIRWYAVWFVAGMILSVKWVVGSFRNDGIPEEHYDRLFIYVFVGGLVGARLGHVFFYEPTIYLSNFMANPLRIFKFWEGGLASHGAVLGTVIAGLLYDRKYKLGFLWMADRVCIGIALIGSFIRVGNLFNSEIIGRPTHGWWAVTFVRVDQIPRHPAQLYEAIFYFVFFFLLSGLYYKTTIKNDVGSLFGIFLIGIFTFRFLIEFLKEDQVPFEKFLPLNLGQILSVPLVVTGLVLFFKTKRREISS